MLTGTVPSISALLSFLSPVKVENPVPAKKKILQGVVSGTPGKGETEDTNWGRLWNFINFKIGWQVYQVGFRTKVGLRCKTLRKGSHLCDANIKNSLQLKIGYRQQFLCKQKTFSVIWEQNCKICSNKEFTAPQSGNSEYLLFGRIKISPQILFQTVSYMLPWCTKDCGVYFSLKNQNLSLVK